MRDRKARYAFLEAFALARICSDSPGRSVLGRPFEAYRRRSQPLFRAVPGVLFLEYALRSISFPETLTDRDRSTDGPRFERYSGRHSEMFSRRLSQYP